MSLEKGISRIGTVIGVIFGVLGGFLSTIDGGFFSKVAEAITIRALSSGNSFHWVVLFLMYLALFTVGFFIWFYLVKGFFWVINWVIKGFKE